VIIGSEGSIYNSGESMLTDENLTQDQTFLGDYLEWSPHHGRQVQQTLANRSGLGRMKSEYTSMESTPQRGNETNALARGRLSLTDDKEVEANETDKYK
jgi:hypothetical protein